MFLQEDVSARVEQTICWQSQHFTHRQPSCNLEKTSVAQIVVSGNYLVVVQVYLVYILADHHINSILVNSTFNSQ